MMRAAPAPLLVVGSSLFVAVAVAGCTPSINNFRAEPNVICKGAQTTLTWTATAGGTLAAVPPDASLGVVASTGSQAVAPAATTTYRLTVTHLGKSTWREVGVEVVTAPTESKQIGASVADPSTTCQEGTLALTVTAPAADWDPHIVVAGVAVTAGVNRAYHVEHAGRAADIAPGAPSTAFAGLPVQGSWRLSTPLGPTEACGRNVPRSLIIDVSSTCARM